MNKQELVSALEAVLFSSGDPISIERLSQVFEIKPEAVEKAADDLQKRLIDNKSGIQLLKLENTYQLATNQKYAEYIKMAFDIKRRTPLSQAALEVLAVIAYNQPVTRAYIEQVRGVDCSGVVSTLVERGLLEEKGRLELPGRPLLYGTTANFLRCFSLNSLEELPDVPLDETAEDASGQLKMLSSEVLDLANQMNAEMAEIEADKEV